MNLFTDRIEFLHAAQRARGTAELKGPENGTGGSNSSSRQHRKKTGQPLGTLLLSTVRVHAVSETRKLDEEQRSV